MKKMILSLFALFALAAARAQESAAAGQSEWLQSFSSVEVSAPLDIRFIRVPDTEAPRIVYDTKGADTRFRAVVKDKVLRITERLASSRTERSVVAVYYNALEAARIEDASAVFDGTLSEPLFDLILAGRASLEATLDVSDLKAELTGHSRATLDGRVRYLTLALSTGTFAAQKLEAMSALVNATNSGAAELWVTDRLEAKTSTGGRITYKGAPAVLRGVQKFMGGTISHVE